MQANHLEPDESQRAWIQSGEDDGPIVALNLNRYRDRAAYPAGTPDADVSGRDAYARYGIVAFQAIVHVGGKIVWVANVNDLAIGCDHDRYDEVVAVWYPKRSSLGELTNYPGYDEAFELHRRAGIEHASLILCKAGPEPELRAPF